MAKADYPLVGDQPGASGRGVPNFEMLVGVAPAQGGELKNVRRCLKPQKADWATLLATYVAAGTAVSTIFKNVPSTPNGGYPGWVFIPTLIAFGAALVSTMRYASAREPDEHLQQAQADVDQLIAWQAEEQVRVNRALVHKIAIDVALREENEKTDHAAT